MIEPAGTGIGGRRTLDRLGMGTQEGPGRMRSTDEVAGIVGGRAWERWGENSEVAVEKTARKWGLSGAWRKMIGRVEA